MPRSLFDPFLWLEFSMRMAMPCPVINLSTYSLAGSFNPTLTLNTLVLPPDSQIDDTFEDVIERIQSKTSQFDAGALNQLMNERFRQAGTTVLSSSEYFASDHSHQSSKAGLY